MAGTRTAPVVAVANITQNNVGISVVDASGDGWSEDFISVGGALPSEALIEAVAVAYQAATQASLFEIRVTNVYRGSRNPTNAEFLARGAAESGINLLYKDTDVLNAVQGQRLVAPVAATMVGSTDIPVYPLVAPMVALNNAIIALIGSGYSLESLQYTGRRERKNNPKISA